MRHRLKDVAERAGVSVKTVSNVVNGYVHVRPDTRARVEEAIAELNYRPNLSARNLRKGRTGVIALAVPELDIPYFAELARYVVTAAAELRLDGADRPDRRRPGAGAGGRLRHQRPPDRRADLQPAGAHRGGPRPAWTVRRWCCSASGSTTARPTTW